MAAKKPPVLDSDEDDAYTIGDEDLSYDKVDEVALAFEAINEIEDPDARKAEARRYFDEMSAQATEGPS